MQQNETCCQENIGDKTCESRHIGTRSAVKIVSILAVCAVFIVSIIAIYTDAFSKSTDTIQVIGQGKVPVRPDGALINLGVIALKTNTPEEAVEITAAKIDNVSKALLEAGISQENQSITGYVLHPIFTSEDLGASESAAATESESVIKGYTASQQITVRIADIENNKARIDDIILAATRAGANQVGEIQLIASGVETLKEEARLKALADAQEKAKEMARVSGINIGRVTDWSESSLATPGQNYQSQNSYYSQPNNTSAVNAVNSAPTGYAILQPGQMDIIIEMTVYYQVK